MKVRAAPRLCPRCHGERRILHQDNPATCPTCGGGGTVPGTNSERPAPQDRPFGNPTRWRLNQWQTLHSEVDRPTRAAVAREGITPGARAVWWAIASHADADGNAWPDVALIALMAGMTTRRVTTNFRELEGAGLLATARIGGQKNRYHIICPQEPQFRWPSEPDFRRAPEVSGKSTGSIQSEAPEVAAAFPQVTAPLEVQKKYKEVARTNPTARNGAAAPPNGGGTIPKSSTAKTDHDGATSSPAPAGLRTPQTRPQTHRRGTRPRTSPPSKRHAQPSNEQATNDRKPTPTLPRNPPQEEAQIRPPESLNLAPQRRQAGRPTRPQRAT